MPESPATFIPASPDHRVAKFFAWYTKRLFAKRFNAVRLTPGSADALRRLEGGPSPAIVLMTHGSWWDPMTAILLNALLTPNRPTSAPMDARMLKKFGFFRKLGVFGIDPDSPESLEAMGRYVLDRFAAEPKTNLWVTAQGEFHDPRTPIRFRPGSAAIAARCPGVRVLCCAIEYAFWTEQRPECFIRVEPVPEPESVSTAGWLREMQAVMEHAVTELAVAVVARDPSRFECLIGGDEAKIHPLYDAWLRLRGKSAAIEVRERKPARRDGARLRGESL